MSRKQCSVDEIGVHATIGDELFAAGRVGLYGECARRIVVRARDLVPLTEWEDFWSASLLGDLCFHVQEHRFTISRLRDFLKGSSLRFLGFEFNAGAVQRAVADAGPIAHYRARFPGERTLSDLGNWEQLEREKSNLFPGYAFVCQRD